MAVVAAPAAEALEVESLDLEGQGVARRPDGKVVFIEGALPGERVRVQVQRRKNNWEQGTLEALLRESPQRVRPACPHFGLHAGACGGCKVQHLHPAAQVAVKQRVLEDDLWHLAKVRPARVLRPIEGPAWGYRWRARLSVRHVAKKGTVLVGFHERKSRYVADMVTCPVLAPAVSRLLVPLRELVGSLDQRDRIPQIEVAVGDAALALVLRHLEPVSEPDRQRLRAFAAAHADIGLQWWLQPKGPDTVHRLDEGGPELGYALPEFDVFMPYRPTDFTQVNPHINRVLVGRATGLLDPRPGERVIDWFCGLGNFSLPLARLGATVLGVEGLEALVARARANAARNGLAVATRFEARDLFTMTPDDLEATGPADRWLVDPPREGAFALVKALADLRRQGPRAGSVPGDEAGGWQPPRRIVYVSCNPAT
ncbi:MAG: 23S rRNA (uracil(1939)-C(5))-methyltransferase RlmD, partial [Rubrivivax sp.]